MAFQVYIYIMCVCIHSLNVAFYRIDRMSVCCLDVGFLRDVAGTTLDQQTILRPGPQGDCAILILRGQVCSSEGSNCFEPMPTSRLVSELILQDLQDTSGYFRILQVYLPIDQFLINFHFVRIISELSTGLEVQALVPDGCAGTASEPCWTRNWDPKGVSFSLGISAMCTVLLYSCYGPLMPTVNSWTKIQSAGNCLFRGWQADEEDEGRSWLGMHSGSRTSWQFINGVDFVLFCCPFVSVPQYHLLGM